MEYSCGVYRRVSGESKPSGARWILPAVNYLFSPIGGALVGMAVAWMIGMLIGGAG